MPSGSPSRSSPPGLCEPRQDPQDARRRPLHATAKGRRLARSIADRAAHAEQEVVDALGERRYRALIDALELLITRDRIEDR